MERVMASSSDAPIHMVIVDQVFIGTDTTGKEMCEDLTCRVKSEVLPPCVLISGSVELSRDGKSSVSSTSAIVECCKKSDITRDVILSWFAAYVNVSAGCCQECLGLRGGRSEESKG